MPVHDKALCLAVVVLLIPASPEPVQSAPLSQGTAVGTLAEVVLTMTFLFVITGPALFVSGWAVGQFWLFWVAPLLGGALGGILHRWLSEQPSAQVTGTTPPAPAE